MAIINGTAASEALVDSSNDAFSTLNANWSAGDDAMFGGAGNDTYNVNSAGDQVFENAGQGTDTVVSRVQSYTLGNNVENLVLDNTPTQLVVQPGGGFALVPAAVDGTGNALNNVITGNDRNNTLSGGDGNDSLGGGAGADTLQGGNGNDSLSGGTGNDDLQGGAGNDTLNGNAGTDTMAGGAGNDTYFIDAAGDSVSEAALFGGVDRVISTISDTLDANVENLTLSNVASALNGTGNTLANQISGNGFNNVLFGLDGNDSLSGSSGNDTLVGGNGADALSGGSGNDTLNGNNDDDSLNGGSGDDTLNGGAGNDVVNGSTGLDFLTGGAGQDRFVFDRSGAGNADSITDFSHADDSIVLSNALDTGLAGALNPGIAGLSFAGGAVAGNALAAGSFFKGVGLTGNAAGNASGIYLNTLDGQVWYNPTAAGGGDALLLGRVEFSVAGSVTANDFIYG
ncbi:calcium-binding protein [Aquabacterium sp. A7-Y]|uniref:calcium-binding protein n=1 Tax=Aquabacterium sp. A7-Y TaxID=1349605 RepID=UPI00223D5691|nr:calcium-binding protein [Aquabacterium sp. A7-Y]MCW7541635.1 calcium-binding protein [Aquabacterium sp. A7-Y]